MDFAQLFTWYFWAYKATPMQPSTMLIMALVFVGAIALGIVIRLISNNKRFSGLQKGQLRIFVKPLVVFGFVELIFLWMHFERIPYFSRRIWFLFILLITIYWIAQRGRKAYKVYPEQQQNNVSSDRDKYLPKQV
ncbi:MAG: hypothetical protein CMI52_01250 [Parcubacteria group bacterium]|nr:hypothetical protein [Parcubacteria group bacterium]|tara:strand:+ start:879 stop:1283 length:405 start_codon:yes stop_codon:yes gene_type:complete